MINKYFSIKKAFIGLIVGLFIGFIFHIHYTDSINIEGMSSAEKLEVETRIMAAFPILLASFGIIGFFIRGFEKTRERFSIAASLIGSVVGYFLCFVVCLLFMNFIGENEEGSFVYYMYYIFMAVGALVFGFFAGGKIPAFYKGEKKFERYGDLWKM